MSPIETELEAIIAQGRRVKRAPRARMRTIGVASTTTRWTLSDNSSVSLGTGQPPPALGGGSHPLLGQQHAVDGRVGELPDSLDQRGADFWVVVPAARPADVARARKRSDRCSTVTLNTVRPADVARVRKSDRSSPITLNTLATCGATP